MAKTIHIGNLRIEVPDDSPMEVPDAGRDPAVANADHPDEPEPAATQPYVYKPSDPLQGPIDRIAMLGNLDRVRKPWVRTMFVVFFLVFPFCMGEGVALALGFDDQTFDPERFALGQLVPLLFCGPYLAIWLAANVRRKRLGLSGRPPA